MSCRNVTSPISARARELLRAAQRGADRGGDGAVDAGQAAVGDHLAAVADRVGAGHQVEVADRAGGADDEQALGRQRAAHRARHLVRRQVGLGGEQRVQPAARRRGRPRATARARPGRRRSAVGRGDRGRPGTVARPTRPAARVATTSTSSRGQQPGDRAGQRGVAEHDDPLDAATEVGVQQESVAAERVGAVAGAAAGFGEQRPAGLLGEDPGRRAGVVAGHHDGARADRRARSASSGCARACGRACGRASGVQRSVGHQRVVELDVEVHRAARPSDQHRVDVRRRRAVRTSRPKMPTWSVVWLAPVPRSRAGRSAVTTMQRQRRRGPPRAPRGAGWRRPCRTCRSTAARRADLGEAEREEPGGALVDAGVQPHQPGRGGVVRRQGQRGVARPGATTTSLTPLSTSAAATTRASRVDAFTRRDPSVPPRQPGLPVRDPVRVRGRPSERGLVDLGPRAPAGPRRPGAAVRQRRRR